MIKNIYIVYDSRFISLVHDINLAPSKLKYKIAMIHSQDRNWSSFTMSQNMCASTLRTLRPPQLLLGMKI